jgi:hypothetical protein
VARGEGRPHGTRGGSPVRIGGGKLLGAVFKEEV